MEAFGEADRYLVSAPVFCNKIGSAESQQTAAKSGVEEATAEEASVEEVPSDESLIVTSRVAEPSPAPAVEE